MITKEEAIVIIENRKPQIKATSISARRTNEAFDMAISALKHSEQVYLDGFKDGFNKGKSECRPKGEWLETFYDYECSNCHIIRAKGRTGLYNFCPGCGADMRGKAE